ncbi:MULTISPECIES: DUF364 domain-containing protein [Caldisericum]|jgi:uncharacterized protein (DUF4213/DUF364 family)|uniref:DUF364 domain-containing protein n=1 Tax=Caldisericum exile TaxID=693075 RepID=A0A2J6XA08_9BACT|nr:MAG: hypothetical protein C0189_00835 [Caldisericum exile]PMP84353.1 MAG: hypothetical protein C0175_00180 [Caldisericum exile]HEM55331.1 hypothetical protein [Thermodesulfobium narugense]
MGLYEDLIENVKAYHYEVIKDVRVGVVWSAVQSKGVGISLTYSSIYDEVEDAGNLIGKSVKELLNYMLTFNLTKVSIGVATLNSLFDVPQNYEDLNMLDYIESISYDKRVVFVGHFPISESLRAKAKEIIVLERSPREGDTIDTAAYYIIPEADIVAITGSTLANKSLESLLSLKRKGITIVFGPSTPLSPVLFDYGVDVIGASVVKHPQFVLNAISQGGKLSNFKKYIEYIVLKKEVR